MALALTLCIPPLQADPAPSVKAVPPAAESLASKENIHLFCIGDSITEGVGAGHPSCYASLIGKSLGSRWVVKNLGVSGATMLKKGDKP